MVWFTASCLTEMGNLLERSCLCLPEFGMKLWILYTLVSLVVIVEWAKPWPSYLAVLGGTVGVLMFVDIVGVVQDAVAITEAHCRAMELCNQHVLERYLSVCPQSHTRSVTCAHPSGFYMNVNHSPSVFT